ncbi:hypothetical protein D3C80_1671170 [compost metagenome]
MLLERRIVGEELQHLGQRNDADHRNTEVALHFLDRRQLAVTALLAVQRDQHASSLGLLALDDLHDFADRGASGDHVVDDQHVAGQWCADQAAAFAVSLGFLAVEAPRQVTVMMLGQGHGGGRRQRDALVRRAKQHVEGNTALGDGGRVETTQLCQGTA